MRGIGISAIGWGHATDVEEMGIARQTVEQRAAGIFWEVICDHYNGHGTDRCRAAGDADSRTVRDLLWPDGPETSFLHRPRGGKPIDCGRHSAGGLHPPAERSTD